jgi:hypothetical protein
VIAEFNVWLLIVGLVVGAGLVWLVMLDSRRRESDIDALELPREAAWLSTVLAEDGFDVSPEAAEQLLLLHRAYLGAPPPDPVETDSSSPAPDGEAVVPEGEAVAPEGEAVAPEGEAVAPEDAEKVPGGTPRPGRPAHAFDESS